MIMFDTRRCSPTGMMRMSGCEGFSPLSLHATLYTRNSPSNTGLFSSLGQTRIVPSSELSAASL